MLRVILIAGIAVLVVSLGKNAQSEEPVSAEVASAAVSEATEAMLPTLTEAQEAQLRVRLEALKKPKARKAREDVVRMGAGAVPRLLEALENQDTVQGQQIVEVLGRIGHPAALPKLEQLMKGKNEWLRSAAVFAIGEIGGKESVPVLLDGLRDPSCRVCEIAIRILVEIRDPRAIPGLIDLLRHSDKEVAQAASRGLVQLTDETRDYGMDWMSWQLWYESEMLFGGLGNGHKE